MIKQYFAGLSRKALRERLLLNREQLILAYKQKDSPSVRRGIENLLFTQGIIMAVEDAKQP